MRVYVPVTLTALRAAVAARELPVGPAFAVTPQLREWYAEGGDEELEDAAREVAARASIGLIAADPEADRRRVVVVIEADAVPGDGGAGAVRGTVILPGPVGIRSWGSALVDSLDAQADVAAAAAVWSDALEGDIDAENAVDDVEDHELLWYGIQELAHEI